MFPSSFPNRAYLQLPENMALASGLDLVQTALRTIQPSIRFIVLTRTALTSSNDDSINLRFNEIDSDGLKALFNHPELAPFEVVGLFESSLYLKDYAMNSEWSHSKGNRILVLGSYYQTMADLTETVYFLKGSSRLTRLDMAIYLSRHGYQWPSQENQGQTKWTYLNSDRLKREGSSDQLTKTLIYDRSGDWPGLNSRISRIDLNSSFQQQAAELNRYRSGQTQVILTRTPSLMKSSQIIVHRLILMEPTPRIVQNYVEMGLLSGSALHIILSDEQMIKGIELNRIFFDLLRRGPSKEYLYEYQTILQKSHLTWVDLNRIFGPDQLRVWPGTVPRDAERTTES